MIAKHVLSYTGRAQPLTAEDVRRDLGEFELAYQPLPDEILVWEHQWLWLAYKAGVLPDAVHFSSQPLPMYGVVTGKNTLWGVPVEVLES